MSDTREVVVLSGVRTAIGGYGGSLKDFPPSELAALCVREAVSRAGVEPSAVDHVVFGNASIPIRTIITLRGWRASRAVCRSRHRL
jgi:acetyl-CoA acetyltransferase